MTTEESIYISGIFEKEKRGLLGFIRSRIPRYSDAEDVLQDVFYQFTTGFQDIRSAKSITSWLYKVARNRITDQYRKRRPESIEEQGYFGMEEGQGLSLREILPSFGNNPEDELIREELWDLCMQALDELPPEQKEVFVLHEFEDMSFRDISDLTGEGVNTLLSRKRYAILHLRERLSQYKTKSNKKNENS